MPTILPRTQITHTPPIQHALDIAQREWPEDGQQPGMLLSRLAIKAADDLETAQQQRRAVRRARLLTAAGRFTGAYPADYLDELRQGWPQ
jgi:hypothetical protein